MNTTLPSTRWVAHSQVIRIGVHGVHPSRNLLAHSRQEDRISLLLVAVRIRGYLALSGVSQQWASGSGWP
jgi:hypothetical protein